MAVRDESDSTQSVVIIGGGPAGLTAGYELQRNSDAHVPVVFEASPLVGGIARTESHNGYRFDIGGHRFFTKVKEVEQLWYEILPDDFITRPRLSRIFYRGKYYDYPLKMRNALSNLGLYEAFRIVVSYMKWQVRPYKEQESFEQWVINRFGGRLYMHFFRSYTQKVWGIDPKEIRADWAAQRIKNLSLFKAVWNAFTGANNTVSLIEEFQYPRLGPGMMWEKCTDLIREKGGEVHLQAGVTKVFHEDNKRVTGIQVEHWTDDDTPNRVETVEGDEFINSMALRDLILCMDPPPPPHVLEAAHKLKYRDFLIVTLVLDDAQPFPDNWIYIHSPAVEVGRIQNFRAWSPEMVPNPDTSSIGMEYFCQEGDALWEKTPEQLREQAAKELETLGLSTADKVIDAAIIRQPKAYPVYDGEYGEALDTIKDYLLGFENFQTVGRNGLHRYNNQDHSMLSAMYAARNILGETNDVWDVNVDEVYHETDDDEGDKPKTKKGFSERLQPRRLSA